MRYLFAAAAAAFCVALALCARAALRKSSPFSAHVARLNSAVLVMLASYAASLLAPISAAAFLTAFSYAAVDWTLVALLSFVSRFTELGSESRARRILSAAILPLCALDTVHLLLSPVLPEAARCISLSPVVEGGEFLRWDVRLLPLMSVHYALSYALSFLAAGRLLWCALRRPGEFRWKYYAVFWCVVGVMLASLTYFLLGGDFRWPVLTYAALSVASGTIALVLVPSDLDSRMKALLSEDISSALVCCDMEGDIVFKNRRAREIFTDDAALSGKFAEFAGLGRESLVRPEGIVVGGEGRVYNALYRAVPDSSGRQVGAFLALSDITSESEELVEEKYRAELDPLTGLFNRAKFFREAQKVLRAEPDIPHYLVCTNIRNFKLVNALFGNETGDVILTTQARMLRRADYPGTVRGRVAGDRFAMLIRKESFDPELAERNTARIQAYMGDVRYKLRILIGVYEITDPAESVHSMYDKASLAIRDIRDDCVRAVAYYDSSLMERLKSERWVVSSFEHALSQLQFEMFLQPQVGARPGVVVGAESLVRWRHPERGMIPPGEFVPVLEKSGHIFRLDMFIWEEAARKLADWQARGIGLYIAVNISAKDFYYVDLYGTFTGLVERYKIRPDRLKLEITETVLLGDFSAHSAVLSRLQMAGFQIEMDDFGSGYSSLNLLRNIRMDVLKVDMAFLAVTENRLRAQHIIMSIIKMAKALGMTVVTEGVETVDQVLFLAEMGADVFQGYFFSRPLSVADFEAKYVEEEARHGGA